MTLYNKHKSTLAYIVAHKDFIKSFDEPMYRPLEPPVHIRYEMHTQNMAYLVHAANKDYKS